MCLSILNTWQGEQWTGCQTISSVLLAVCTLFNNKPLLNEPAVTEQHRDYKNYNKIITYKNFDTAMLHVLNNDYTKTNFSMFMHIMQAHFLERFDANIEKLNELCKTYPTQHRTETTIYRMSILIDYKELLDNFHNAKNVLL